MRNLRWLAATFVLFLVTLVLSGGSDFRDLGHVREWKAVPVDAADGELDGIRVGVREVKAAVVDTTPDRALLFVRVALQGPQDSIDRWVDCRVSVQTPDGSMWLPVYGPAVRGVIQTLASDGEDNSNCLVANISEDGPTSFDQLYRLPRSALDNLSLHVSGHGTRPSALSFPLRPEVREFRTSQ